MIVISMKILRNLVKSVPGHNIFYREITKKFLIRPVHFTQTYVSLYFRNRDWCPCGIGFQLTALLSGLLVSVVIWSKSPLGKIIWRKSSSLHRLSRMIFGPGSPIKGLILTFSSSELHACKVVGCCCRPYIISVSVNAAEAVSNIHV